MDRPVTNADALHFGGRRIADRLDTYLAKVTRDESALVVGLSGPWGSGKSSIVGRLQKLRIAGSKDVELLRLTDMPHPATLLFEIGKALARFQRGKSYYPFGLYYLALGSSKGPAQSTIVVGVGVAIAIHLTVLSGLMGANWAGISTLGVSVMALIATVIATSVQTSNTDAFGMFIDVVHALPESPPKSSHVIILDEFDRLDDVHMRLVLRAISVISGRLKGVCIVLCYDKEQVKAVLYPPRHQVKGDSADGNKDGSKNRSQIPSTSFGDDFAKYINVEFAVPIYSRAEQAIELVKKPLLELSKRLGIQVSEGEDVEFLAPGYYYPRHFVRARILAGSMLASMPLVKPRVELPVTMGELITASLLRVVCPDAARVISELYFESGAKRDYYTIQVEKARRRAILTRIRDSNESDPSLSEAIGELLEGGLGALSDKKDPFSWELTWKDSAKGVIYALYLLESLDEAPELRRLVTTTGLLDLLRPSVDGGSIPKGSVTSRFVEYFRDAPPDVELLGLMRAKLPKALPVYRRVAQDLYDFVLVAVEQYPYLYEELGLLAWTVKVNQTELNPDSDDDFRAYIGSTKNPLLLSDACGRLAKAANSPDTGEAVQQRQAQLHKSAVARLTHLCSPSLTPYKLPPASGHLQALAILRAICSLASESDRRRVLHDRWTICPNEAGLVAEGLGTHMDREEKTQAFRVIHEYVGMNIFVAYGAELAPSYAATFEHLLAETKVEYLRNTGKWEDR